MGIKGLTTYLRENRVSIARLLHLPLLSDTDNTDNKQPIQVVVDGWSFIYAISIHSRLPWVYGGEYSQIVSTIEHTMDAWFSVGIHPSFVFDGPPEPIKFPTLQSRMTISRAQNSELFFRTSVASRNTPRFLAESRILPPLSYHVFITTLQRIHKRNPQLTVYYADREADAFCVELAGQLGAYVIGNDSDFVVLNTPGYLGYIPLDDFLWVTTSDKGPEVPQDDFVPVSNGKRKKYKLLASQMTLRDPVPPATVLGLTLTVYTPAAVAKQLGVTAALLPLVGAIIGNDYKSSHETYLFEKRLNALQRVNYTANTLSTILSKFEKKTRAAGSGAQKSVLDLIRTAISQMLLRPNVTTEGEINKIVDAVVESALQYAIPPPVSMLQFWPSEACPLHDHPYLCRLPSLIPTPEDEELEAEEDPDVAQRKQVRALYLREYRTGLLDAEILDIITTGTMWPRMFLESPDAESAHRVYGRPIRLFAYAILEESIGLPVVEDVADAEVDLSVDARSANGTSMTGRTNDIIAELMEDDDEIIDVFDEDSEEDDIEEDEELADPLAALQGALQRLRGTNTASRKSAAPGLSTIPDGEESEEEGQDDEEVPDEKVIPKVVNEYVRRGSRIAAEEVVVVDLHTLLEASIQKSPIPFRDNIRVPRTSSHKPIRLEPEDIRFAVLLRALCSDSERIAKVGTDRLFSVLVCRWVIMIAAERDSHVAIQAKWSRSEAKALLHAFCAPASSSTGDSKANEVNDKQDQEEERLDISLRSVQLMSGALATSEALWLLIQSLGLTHKIPHGIEKFSGEAFHRALALYPYPPVPEPVEALWKAVEDGLEGMFGPESKKRPKKNKVKTAVKVNSPPQSPKKTAGGKFSILASLGNS